MLKVLAATDFSDASKHAIRYALKITEDIPNEIILLNVVYMDGPPAASMSSTLLEAMKTKAYYNFQVFAGELKQEFGDNIRIRERVEIGYPAARIIEKVAAEEDVEFIALGMKGLSAIAKVFIGSVAASVAMNSKFPVLIVPQETEIKKATRLIDATDLYQNEEEFKKVTYFAGRLNAQITMLHIFPSKEACDKTDLPALAENMRQRFNTDNFDYDCAINPDVVEGIANYIKSHQTDILVVFTHKRLFYERWFNRSVTKDIAYESHIPTLVLKAD